MEKSLSLVKSFTKNAENAAMWIIGGLENSVSDYGDDTDAQKILDSHSRLVELVYENAIENLYRPGAEFFGRANPEWRFLGKPLLTLIVENAVKDEGY